MAATLDELLGNEPTNLDQLIDTNTGTNDPLPPSQNRNRAAISALQTGEPVENFQTYMADKVVGSEQSLQETNTQIQQTNAEGDFNALVSTMSDPNIPIEQKQAAVDNFSSSSFLSDPEVNLATSALTADSEGMTPDQDAVRVTTADTLADYYAKKGERQALINAFIQDNNSTTGIARSFEWLRVFTPGNEAAESVGFQAEASELMGEGSRGVVKTIKDMVLTGFSTQEFREKFDNMDDYTKTQMLGDLLNAVKENDGIIFNENQVAAVNMANRYLQGEYTTSEAVFDSALNILDILGIGVTLKGSWKALTAGRRAGDAARAGQVADEATQISKDIRNSTNISSDGLAKTLPEAVVPARADALDAARAEHQGLIAESSNILDPGSVRNLREEMSTIQAEMRSLTEDTIKARAKEIQLDGVSYKQALSQSRKEADARRVELEARENGINASLESNAKAQQAANRIPAVENRISVLSQGTEVVPARLNPIMDAISRVEMNSVIAPVNPSAAANVLGYFNPSKGRNAFKALYNSPGEDLALAGYGTSKQDAIVAQVMPQMATESNKVAAKVVDVERTMKTDFPYDEGGLRFTAKEQDIQASNVLHDFKNVNGLTPHDAEATFRVDVNGGQLDVRAMYGTSEGGFITAEDAVRQTKHALRDYGILDKDITVVKRDGVDYVPVDPASVRGVQGDYKVQISKTIDQNLELMGDGWEHFDVKRNFFDRFPSTQFTGSGTVNRMLIDAASNVHPAISGSFATAVDRGSRLDKLLLKQADVFAKQYVKFPKDRQKKVWEYLLEANRDGLPHNLAELKARGFADTEIDAMKDFRNFWDTHYQLENLDRVRTYRAEGYQILETKLGDRYFARPVAKNTNNRTNVFDPATDSVRDLTQAELDDLYNQGGTLATFKETTDFDGVSVTHMISRNSPDEYLRTLDDTDKVLNYREGYFQIQYKNARFIDEVRPDGTTRTVAIAGDIPSAEAEVARLQQINGREYVQRGDERGIRREGDSYWSVNSVSGRIAQRRRGKLLEGSTGPNHLDYTFIENPIDSAIRAARSISGRTVSRPAIETAKARAMKQYGHMLPKDQFGNPVYPNDIKNLAVKGAYTTKELADARTTFEYINRMENGYINTIDETTKAIMNWMGDGLGKAGLGALERGARTAGDVGVTGALRATAFQAYIALNPIRNWIMQPIQVARTLSYNPIDWANGKIPGYMASAVKYKMGGKMTAEESRFVKALQDTGMLDGVDRSSLVRGAMLQATERSNNLVKGLSWGMEMSRKIGFDLGENANLIGHYAAVYSKYERKGADLTNSRVLAEIQSEARAISGEMNKAGDLAYTQNWMSVPLQFAQVPHKFILGITNRRIPLDARIRMAAGDVLMWGIPGTYALTDVFGDKVLPSDPEWRDAVVSGAAAWIVNKILQTIFDDDTRIDFESLAPYNLGGMGDLAERVWTGGLGDILESTPSGQLFFKDSGRFGTAMRTLFRYLSPSEEGLQSDEDFMDVINTFAKISSGWNNITKAYMAYQTKMYLDKKGLPIDKNVTTTEAIAMAFGFAPKEVGEHYATMERLYDRRESAENTARELATGIVETAMNTSDDKRFYSAEMVSKRSSALMFLAKQDPAMARMVDQELSKMLKDPEQQIKKALVESSGLINPDEVISIIRGSPLPDQEKKNSEDFITNIKQALENFNQRGE